MSWAQYLVVKEHAVGQIDSEVRAAASCCVKLALIPSNEHLFRIFLSDFESAHVTLSELTCEINLYKLLTRWACVPRVRVSLIYLFDHVVLSDFILRVALGESCEYGDHH